jgi:hypothetical protein
VRRDIVNHGMNLWTVWPFVTVEDDGWHGRVEYPTFYVLGGSKSDAVHNADRVINVKPGDKDREGRTITSVSIDVVNADA